MISKVTETDNGSIVAFRIQRRPGSTKSDRVALANMDMFGAHHRGLHFMSMEQAGDLIAALYELGAPLPQLTEHGTIVKDRPTNQE